MYSVTKMTPIIELSKKDKNILDLASKQAMLSDFKHSRRLGAVITTKESCVLWRESEDISG